MSTVVLKKKNHKIKSIEVKFIVHTCITKITIFWIIYLMAKKVKIIHIRKHKFNAKSLFMKKKMWLWRMLSVYLTLVKHVLIQ